MNLRGLKAKIKKTEEEVIVMDIAPDKYRYLKVLQKNGNMKSVDICNLTILEPEKAINQEESKPFSFIGKKVVVKKGFYEEGKEYEIISEPILIETKDYGIRSHFMVKDNEGDFSTIDSLDLKIKD